MPSDDAVPRSEALSETAPTLSAVLLRVYAELDLSSLLRVICETVSSTLHLPFVSLVLAGDPRKHSYIVTRENKQDLSFNSTEQRLSYQGQILGALILGIDPASEISATQRTLLDQLLPHLAQAVWNALQISEQHRRADELAAILETVQVLSVQKDLQYFLDSFSQHVVNALNGSAATIYLCEEAENDLELAGVSGIARSQLERRVSFDNRWIGKTAKSRHTHTFQERLVNQLPFAPPLAESLQSGIQAPMLCSDELIGVFGLYSFWDKPRTFTSADVRLLELLANQAASEVHNRRMFELVRASRERLQNLSYRLMQAHEQERRAIARELHDEIGQTLTGFQLNLQALARALPPSVELAPLQDAMTGIETALEQLRDLSRDLRPSILDDFGLVPAMEWYAARVRRRSNLVVELLLDSIETRLPVETETACFRVMQEAITNTLRHAHATRVRVTLKYQVGELELTIEDDGKGFDVTAALEQSRQGASLGLLGMQERILLSGGRVKITSTPGIGARLWCVFPLDRAKVLVERRQRRRTA